MKNDGDDRILEFIELSRLYDRYGGLLSEKSKKIVESYVVYDMSLGETAAETGLSRQGVRDVLIRSHEKLKKIGVPSQLTKKIAIGVCVVLTSINLYWSGRCYYNDIKNLPGKKSE